MIAEHQAISIKDFNGLFDRGPNNSVPNNHFIDCLNVDYDVNNVFTRDGSIVDLLVPKTIRRVRSYEKTGEATRYLILDFSGNLFDSTSMGSPILSIPQMTDFALQVMYERAYISPHNGDRGLPGEWLYVYDGTGICRKAAGAAPFSAPTATTATAAGFVELGDHLIAISFQTHSGYITKRGPAVLYKAPGGKSVIVANIPIGPTGTIGRYVLSTMIIKDYNGNQESAEYFFVPNGYIPDNTTTTITLSYFDANLVSSADYLYDQLDAIPAGVYLGIFKGALVSVGEDANFARARISKPNEPESHDAVTGFCDVYPKDNGGPLRACIEFRAQLIFFKSYRSYITMDNGNNPGFWIVTALDKSVGSECNGICKVLDVDGTSNDQFLVSARQGLMIFDGSFSADLSWKIGNLWDRINRLYFNKVLVALDPIAEKCYVAVPLDDATECSHILVGDYANGMDAENVKWAVWKFAGTYAACFVDVLFSSKRAVMKFAKTGGNIYRMDISTKTDEDLAIDSYVRFAEVTPDENGVICLFSGIRADITGVGSLQVDLYSIDSVLTQTAPSIALNTASGKLRARSFLFENEKLSVRLRTNNNLEWFNLKKFWVYSTQIWAERPDEE